MSNDPGKLSQEQYLQLLQERNRLKKKLNEKTPEQLQVENKERGFVTHFGGANKMNNDVDASPVIYKLSNKAASKKVRINKPADTVKVQIPIKTDYGPKKISWGDSDTSSKPVIATFFGVPMQSNPNIRSATRIEYSDNNRNETLLGDNNAPVLLGECSEIPSSGSVLIADADEDDVYYNDDFEQIDEYSSASEEAVEPSPDQCSIIVPAIDRKLASSDSNENKSRVSVEHSDVSSSRSDLADYYNKRKSLKNKEFNILTRTSTKTSNILRTPEREIGGGVMPFSPNKTKSLYGEKSFDEFLGDRNAKSIERKLTRTMTSPVKSGGGSPDRNVHSTNATQEKSPKGKKLLRKSTDFEKSFTESAADEIAAFVKEFNSVYTVNNELKKRLNVVNTVDAVEIKQVDLRIRLKSNWSVENNCVSNSVSLYKIELKFSSKQCDAIGNTLLPISLERCTWTLSSGLLPVPSSNVSFRSLKNLKTPQEAFNVATNANNWKCTLDEGKYVELFVSGEVSVPGVVNSSIYDHLKLFLWNSKDVKCAVKDVDVLVGKTPSNSQLLWSGQLLNPNSAVPQSGANEEEKFQVHNTISIIPLYQSDLLENNISKVLTPSAPSSEANVSGIQSAAIVAESPVQMISSSSAVYETPSKPIWLDGNVSTTSEPVSAMKSPVLSPAFKAFKATRPSLTLKKRAKDRSDHDANDAPFSSPQNENDLKMVECNPGVETDRALSIELSKVTESVGKTRNRRNRDNTNDIDKENAEKLTDTKLRESIDALQKSDSII